MKLYWILSNMTNTSASDNPRLVLLPCYSSHFTVPQGLNRSSGLNETLSFQDRRFLQVFIYLCCMFGVCVHAHARSCVLRQARMWRPKNRLLGSVLSGLPVSADQVPSIYWALLPAFRMFISSYLNQVPSITEPSHWPFRMFISSDLSHQ